MKLNFWQWIGVLLLVAGVIVFIYERRSPKPADPGTTPAPATQPTTQPAARP